jgi:hypothetical protein
MQQKLFRLSGIAFVVLVVLSVVAIGGGTPDAGAPGNELARFYDGNALRQGISAFVLAAATPLIVFFGIGIATSVGSRRAGGMSGWAYVLLSGTILVAGSVLVSAFVHFALANGGDEGVSPTALEALNSLDGNTWMVFNPAFGVMMLGAAGVFLSVRVRRWVGWSALCLGIAAFVPFADFFALLGTLLWIAVTSIVLARAAAHSFADANSEGDLPALSGA